MIVQILSGVGNTLLITALSLVFGAALGLPLVAARRSSWRPLQLVASAYIDVVRAIPPITWLFLIYFGLPQYALKLNPITASIVGFSLIAAAYMAETYRAGLLSIPAGQWEAATALGMGFFSTTQHVITPQAFRVTLPAIAAYAIALLKDSALASTIGVHDITYQAGLVARSSHQGLLAFTIAGLLYIALSLPLALAARRVDKALRIKLEVA
ncbi:amino acid ABC transporter permease [Paenarthrobacter sp. CM16]|uniref:amino acid ABC transporter permease n=1 Tax=Paenarthrobacter sp. CM16 TaxID=2738447 RepID=UPI001556838A|nr:amino acid ABC transporter permease [Paenarthrobacter sp. CM16]NQD87796.1 amino acid ABC transporter permease [Paenarthrobacter sp. CM16]